MSTIQKEVLDYWTYKSGGPVAHSFASNQLLIFFDAISLLNLMTLKTYESISYGQAIPFATRMVGKQLAVIRK